MRIKKFKETTSHWTQTGSDSGHYYGEFQRSADKVTVIVTLHSKNYKLVVQIFKGQHHAVFKGGDDNYGLSSKDNKEIKSLVSMALNELEVLELSSAFETSTELQPKTERMSEF